MADQVDQFWEFVERRMGCDVPKHLQNILQLRGYENAVSIRTITRDDIKEMQDYVRSEQMKKRLPSNANLKDYYGCFSNTPGEFEFLPGHIKLLEQIVDYLKLATQPSKVPKGDLFNFKSKSTNMPMATAPTLPVNIVKDAPLRNPIQRNTLPCIPSATDSNIQTNPANVESSNVLQLNDLGMESIRCLEHVNVDSSQLIQDLEEAQVQEKIQNCVQDEELCRNIKSTRQHSFQTLISWMKKNTRSVYEQFSDQLNETMVVVTKNEKTEENVVKLCVSVICPICSSSLVASETSQVLCNGTKNYFGFSGFHKHLRAHINKSKRNLAIKKLSVKSLAKSQSKKESEDNPLKRNPNKAKVTKTRSSKRQQEMSTSSDSDENEELKKELAESFKHEIDNALSDLEVSSASDEDTQEDTSTYRSVDIPSSSLVMPKLRKKGDDIKADSKSFTENNYQKTIESLLKENEIFRKRLQQARDEAGVMPSREQTNSEFNMQLNSEDHLILRTLVNTAQRNISREKPGYRHDDIMKVFAAYIKMIGGTLTHETLHANLPLCWPSLSSANNFIRKNGLECIEGKIRSKELLNYLNERKLPLRVSLSEDATRITARITYDPDTNQLVGFALPLDENGMPIPLSFPARTSKEIQKHYSNPSNNVSSNAYVQMAQPQSRSVPPFCLLLFLTDNTFTSESLLSRWNFTTNDLRKFGIKVDNYASDGDSRPAKVMKFKSQIGVTDLNFLNCEWYSCGNSIDITYTQDYIHVGTKARSRFCKTSRVTPIGQKIISVSHLKNLIRTVSKDKHLLTAYDIEPKDKQNFHSVEKICDQRVMSTLLEYVPGSEGTVMFLKALNYTLYSYLDSSMSSAARVYKSWCGLFFFRIWRSWLISSKYTLKESFISSNCYLCIELNAHSLVKQILKLDDGLETTDYGGYMFNPDLQGSQPCEALFRQARSFSSMYSNVSNFDMLEFVNRINKIQLQSDIIHNYSGRIKFPRFEKKQNNIPDQPQSSFMLSKNEIITQIEKAKSDIIKDFESLGIDTKKLDFHCQIKPTVFQTEFDYDDDIDDDDSSDEENAPENDIANVDDEAEDDNMLLGVTGELLMRDYSNTDKNLDEAGPLAFVTDSTGKEKIVRKTSICWYLNKDRCKLSSDRLKRVMEKGFQNTDHKDCSNTLINNSFEKLEEICIGDWSIFETDDKLLVGQILSFCYVNGKTFKDRNYTKSSAYVKSEKTIGVLASWYTWDSKGELVTHVGKQGRQHKFIEINNYIGTLRSPSYYNQTLSITKAVMKILNEMDDEFKSK